MEATLWKGLLVRWNALQPPSPSAVGSYYDFQHAFLAFCTERTESILVQDVYQQRLRAHPISYDWQGSIPPRTWEGWAFLAQDYAALVVPLDNPVFRVRQAVKIALQADAANLSGIGPVDWTAVEDQICNLMIGAIPASQIPATQIPATQIEVPVAPRDEIPVIIMQERQKRGKRNDLRYLVALPGQSDGDGEWYSRRELITDFPENWETMLERWRDFLFQKHQERVQKESDGQQAVEVVHLDHRPTTAAAAGGGGDGGGNAGNDTNTDTDTNRKNMQKNKTSPGDDEHVRHTDKEVIDPGDDGSGAAASNQGEATAGGHHDHQASAILGGGGGGNGNIPEQAMHHPVDDGEAAMLDHADSAGAGRRGNNLAAMAPATATAADAFRPPPLPAPHVEGTSTTAYRQRVLLPPPRATSRPLSAPDGVTVLALAGQARREHPRDGGVHHDFAAELRPMTATNGTLVDPQWQFLPAAMPRQADTAAAPASISRHQPEALPLQQSPQPQEQHHRHALTNNHSHDQQPQKKRVKRDLYSIMQSMSKGRPASPLHSPAAAAAAPPLRSAASPQQQQLAPTSQRTSPRVSRIWQACGALTQQQQKPQALGSKLSPSMTQQRTTTMSTDMSVATGIHPLVASNIAYARQHGYAMALPSIAMNGAAARDVRESAPNAEGRSAAAAVNGAHVDESNEDAAAADVAPKKISAASKRRQRRAAPSRQQPQKTKTAAAVTVAVVNHVADNTKNPDKIRGGDDAKRASPPPAQPKAKGRALAAEGADALREAPHAGAADPDTGTNGDTVRVEGAEKTHKMEAEDAPAGTPTRRPRRVTASKAAAAGTTKQAEGEKGRRQQALKASLPAVIPDTESEREGTGQDGSASRGSIEDMLDSYLSTDKWSDARITGAKEVDGGISVWIEWADGFSAIVPSVQLRRNDRVHCMVSLIQFYESKTKKKKRKS